MKNRFEIIITILLVLVFIGFILLILNMFIHNQCMQLIPSNHYESTICENYWNNTDWKIVKKLYENSK